jgi:type I restriction enzyme R subunit
MTGFSEKGFEDGIEAWLLAHGGYAKGRNGAHGPANPEGYDAALGLWPGVLVAFLKLSQPEAWARLEKLHGPASVEAKVVKRVVADLDLRGTLDVLRHGVTDSGVPLRLAFFRPASGLNPEAAARYALNRLTVTRQVHYATKDPALSIDLVLAVNGLPVATAELKEPLKGQTTERAIRQYKTDRDTREPLLRWKHRALVHFAVDTDLAFMTTRLAGTATRFLPFNRGRGTGAGNPDNPGGYKTAYLWETVWARDCWMDVLQRFLHLEKRADPKTGKAREEIVFPRFHQLDAVTRLLSHARAYGPGQNYLVQHSAGSGKSNSIAWLAHQLAGLHDAADRPVFTSVIVITDRRVLDRQLQDNIYQFEHAQGVVQKVDADSAQLAAAINAGTRIIITTLQKFSFVMEKVTAKGDRRYAVIVDEAHGSQTGEGAASMKRVLASTLERAEAEDPDDDLEGEVAGEVEKAMAARGRQPNISFFAFTATPKQKTMELFGQPGPDGKPRAFHTYPMRQAIEEGFILDVLKNYTTYKAYYRFTKAITDDPEVDEAKAKRAVARFASLHPHNLAQKVEVMVEHFRQHTRQKIGGEAKAMLVTRSRLHAVRYRQAFADYLAKKGYDDVGVLVAFSGTVVSEEDEFTEAGMNGFGEKELPERFDTEDYTVLIVAEKYQTGFDQPLLHTMFVDRKLKGLKAVQTLSRLNRTAAGKEDTFVLDFENEAEEMKEAFAPYYEVPSIDEPTDPNQLYTLKTAIEAFGYVWKQEAEDFAKVFFKPKEKQKPSDQGLLHAALDPAVGRFAAEPEEDRQEAFRAALGQFVRLYGFVSQVMPWTDAGLEKFYAYARHLRPKLPQRPGTGGVDLDDEVALTYYRLSKTGEGSIALPVGDEQVLAGPTEVGTGKARGEDLSPLSTIIQTLNTKFGTDFTEADRLLFDQVATDLSTDDGLTEQARTNPIENFRLVFEPAALAALVSRMERNGAISDRLMGDADFRAAAMEGVMREVWMRARRGPEARP